MSNLKTILSIDTVHSLYSIAIINSNDVFEFILRRVERSYKAIYDIVNKLDVLSLEQKRQLTIPLVKEIL